MSRKSFWAATFSLFLFFAMGMVNRSAAEWTIQAVDAPKFFTEFSQRAIAIDRNGRPHIAYVAYGGDHLYYAYHDGSRWQYETADPSPGVGRHASIALDGSGAAHISYWDYTNNDLKYATNRSGSWQTFTVDSAGGVGKYTSIALDGSGAAHISYFDGTNGDLKYATNAEWVPVPDIRANGSDGPVTIAPGDPLRVTVALDPGSHEGEPADWWVAAATPFGFYWYTLDAGWVRSDAPIRVYGGPLFSLSPYTVLEISKLPTGAYTFYFGCDMAMNGSLDMDRLYYDRVEVTVTP